MVLDEIIIAISGIAAGIVTALVTVWREHKKDIMERYEERADLYKKEHFRKLEDIIKNEIDREKKIIEGSGNETSKGIEAIKTPGVNLTYNFNKIKIDAGLEFITDGNILSHIESGYKELYAIIEEAKKHEEDYINLLNKTINPIMDELHEIQSKTNKIRDVENVYTPISEVIEKKTWYGEYYKSDIIDYIIDDVDFETDCIRKDDSVIGCDEEKSILTFRKGMLEDKGIDNFLNICNQIKNEHSEEIEKIETMNTQIDEIYKGILGKLNDIVSNLDAGQRLEGKCNICKKIDDAQSKKSLMPFS